MAIGGTLLIVLLLVGAIWLFVEVKRFRHKALALFIIVLILFIYLGFTVTIKGKNVDLKTIDGIKDAGQFYLSWLGSIFSNFKTLTSNAVNMDWKVSENEMNYKTNTTGIFKK